MVWKIIVLFILIIALYVLAVTVIIPTILEKRLENYQNETLSRQYEEIRNTYWEMRGWRHDLRNHMQVLKAHLDSGDMKKCQSYLEEMEADLNEIDAVVKNENVMADAILNSKLSLAKSKNIKLNVTANIPSSIPLTDTEFCIIFGNLMDNAIEACEKISEENKRFIRIYIGMFKKQFYISVGNATDSKIRVKRYRTLKGEGHGMGLYRIDKIVKKHDGYLNRENEPGVFVTELMIPYE